MATPAHEALEAVEHRRVQLQENVDKLRKAMSHWTTWEAEYQMLKEEIESAHEPSASQMRDMAREFRGSLVQEKEIDEMLRNNQQVERSANQVVDLISRRIDYVQQNSATIAKQLDAAEKRLAGTEVLLDPGLENEEGLPMMDIEEELDEDGNEISTSISQTGKSAAEIVEVLRKAGVQKAERNKKIEPIPTSVEPTSALKTHGYNDDLAASNFNSGTKVIELDTDDNIVASYPIIPQGESPEDAELRRQMLQYGLSEVGQVVAELDLHHPTATFSEEDDSYDDYDTEEEDIEDQSEYEFEDEYEDEDKYGRSTKPELSDEYRTQMLELEKKLNARMLENIGPRPNASPLAQHVDDIRTMRVRNNEHFDDSMDVSVPETGPSMSSEPEPRTQPKKKGVRFADGLDISEAPSRRAPQTEPKTTTTISDMIVERSTMPHQAPTQPSKSSRVSRFKNARAAVQQPSAVLPAPSMPEAQPVPTGPSGRTLASTITEHQPIPSVPQAPDQFDPVVLQREIQADYHRARNQFIQQQGGFTPADDEVPVVEEQDGKSKKVSRFMAARLKADSM
ncbi:hypothetical protein IQ07DRAFT_501267 [Pyrenochaeta sp. DS3sAY3a]|nr:hypothetical protein IQ07DRAFT_501267 [Pyrenochaeta sp. DS3sAY3a]